MMMMRMMMMAKVVMMIIHTSAYCKEVQFLYEFVNSDAVCGSKNYKNILLQYITSQCSSLQKCKKLCIMYKAYIE